MFKEKSAAAATSGAEMEVVDGAITEAAKEAMIQKERKANSAWRKFIRNKSAVIGLIIVIVMLAIGIFAPLIAPFDPNATSIAETYLEPGVNGHIFGTDDLGRDLFSRIVYGARMSIVVAIGSTVLGGVIGIILGLVAGFMGGIVDSIIMRVMDGLFAFPFILLSLLLVTILGSGVFNVILAIGIGNVPRFARVVRSKVIVAKNEEFCNVERVLGASNLRLMVLHILPSTVSEVVVYATLCVGGSIIAEAGLSFLGLGILIPTPSWGNILRGGQTCLAIAPHIATISGLFIFVAVIGFNLLGDGIRDVLDPKMKK